MFAEAAIDSIRAVPAGTNLRVGGPAFVVSKWAPRLRRYRTGIEAFYDRAVTC